MTKSIFLKTFIFDVLESTLCLFQLMLLKLVAILFPTSDFRHAVTTPAITFIAQMLAEVFVYQ